jgi:hypothetical protein
MLWRGCMANAYVVLVRPTMEGAFAEVIEVSHWLGQDANLSDLKKANEVLIRMGEEPAYNIKKEESLASYINMLWLRARMNNAEGPFLVKTEEPIEGDDWDKLVRNPEFMNRMRKEMKL